MPEMTYWRALNLALHELMALDERVFVMGRTLRAGPPAEESSESRVDCETRSDRSVSARRRSVRRR